MFKTGGKIMNKKNLSLSLLAVGLLLPSALAPVAAKEGTGTTPVTYDNRNYIPDPENPDSPEWAVAIPTSINFTDDNKEIDASVELVTRGPNGKLPTDSVKVSVQSANGYKLKNGVEEISYKLTYDATLSGTTKSDIAILTSSATKKTGTAILGSEVAKTRGAYTDRLTYTIDTVKP